MRVIQIVSGLGLIVLLLAVETLVLIALAWIVLSVVRYVPLVGRRHRHQHWEPSPPRNHELTGSLQERMPDESKPLAPPRSAVARADAAMYPHKRSKAAAR